MADILIRCKQRRAGGSKIPLLNKTYHFAPLDAADPEAPHVCAIPESDAAAIHRLLAIKEGFELVDADAALPAKPKAEPGQTIGNEKAPAVEVKPIVIQCGDEEIDLTALAPDALRKLAKEEFKIAVHHKWADQTVIAKIIEKTRGED